MNANVEFDEIRPYHDEELPQVYEELIADAAFRQAVDTVMPGVPFEVWSQKMRACKTKLEFQKTFCYGLLWKLAKEATDGLTLDHTALPADKSAAYTYISNHRDIILDSGFLPHIQTLIAVGMVTMGIFFPLQGWMMAIDGILIGARDYRYLAVTCTLTAVVYVTLILILANMVTPALTSDLMRTAVLWAAFNVVLMGGRGLSNGLRVRSDAWMR